MVSFRETTSQNSLMKEIVFAISYQMKHYLLFVNMNQMNRLVATNTDIYATICLIDIPFWELMSCFSDAQDARSSE